MALASARPRGGLAVISSVCAGVMALGCASSQAPLHPPGPAGSWYLVKEGDTLATIAGRDGVAVEDLAEINGLKRGEALRPGQIIFLLDPAGLRGRVGGEASAEGETSAAATNVPAAAKPGTAGPPPETPVVVSGQNALLRWPLQAPRLSSPFGLRQGRVHEGIDLPAPIGTPIFAARDGVVLYAGDAVRGYGNMLVLQHEGDLLTVYAHNSIVLVKAGEQVRAGQEVARVGQSGRASAPHLHFEVRKGQVPQDPLRFLPKLR